MSKNTSEQNIKEINALKFELASVEEIKKIYNIELTKEE